MKNIIFSLAIIAISITACNSNNQKSGDNGNNMGKDTAVIQQPVQTSTPQVTAVVSIKEIVNGYLQVKNALTKDDTNDAATAATSLQATFKSFDNTALTADQKKVFEEIAADGGEHAEHIGKNGGNIAHQREHFEMLSKDITDLLKTFGNGGQILYKDFCPMYNDNKGAFWISETKDIKNPYLGKAMPTCGTMKEEIK